MSVRKVSTSLRMVCPVPVLIERDVPAVESQRGALEWQGKVRLAADRASGISAPRRQQQVRTGLFERAVVLGADHRGGPHLERPESARRLLAHIDALAEAGLSPAELRTFAEEADVEHPGVLWVVTLLFGCLDAAGAEDEFGAWVESLDEALFVTYRGVLEIGEALRTQPNPRLRQRARRWLDEPEAIPCAIALEMTSPDELREGELSRLARNDDPFVQAAIERLGSRSPGSGSLGESTGAPWAEATIPALAYQIARARILKRDFEPLVRLRQSDARAIDALGPYAVDLIALAGDGRDERLVLDLVRKLPTDADLLDAIGRVGFPSLFPRLLAELGGDDFDEEADRALVTALGPRAAGSSRRSWEVVIQALPSTPEPMRRRGGEPYSSRAVLEEMKRPDLSAQDLRARADEILAQTGKRVHVEWDVFGSSLGAAISELSRHAR